MSKRSYKLRCSIIGHEKDVRSVCPSYFPNDGFISTSRDVSTKIWMPNESDPSFTEGHCMSGHNNFVMSVAVLPPDDAHPQGQIVTGSLDHNILAYTLNSPQPIYKLEGHQDCVCSLAPGKFGTLLSGSWDKNAKVWLNKKCVMTLEGHEKAVWAVAVMPEGGFMLTGSADQTIKMWKAGRCETTFRGHNDCVRGLAVMSTTEFLSCSNDATVRHWLTTGECVHTYYGHTNFIYGLALLPNGRDFVSVGEDRSLRVWNNGECEHTITHPCTSVWCVTVLANGDIITGSSDGVLRVFTCDASRMADPEEQKAFEESVAGSEIPSQIGDIKMDDLPGPEALLNPGKRDGQTAMIHNGPHVEAHQWNASEGRWTKIGDVMGGSGGSQQSSGKQLYQGKEYDYVFDVELTEDRPPIKLPYNITEDPWLTAHNWLGANDLDQMFLDQVAKFIMDQTKGVTLDQALTPSVSDPLTGGGRYVPGSGNHGDHNGVQGSSNPDPFTGGGSYQPGGGPVQTATNPYFPKSSYLLFEAANIAAIIGKLTELNGKVPETARADVDSLASLKGLISGEPAQAQYQVLAQLLQWPNDMVFPVLDVLRLAILNKNVMDHLFQQEDSAALLSNLLQHLTTAGSAANKMLVLRILTNAFQHAVGEAVLLAQRDTIVASALECAKVMNKNVQIALVSLLLNYSVAFRKKSDLEGQSQCLSSLGVIAQSELDAEAAFRWLVCLGTLVHKDDSGVALARSLDLEKAVMKFIDIAEPKKISDCARYILLAIN